VVFGDKGDVSCCFDIADATRMNYLTRDTGLAKVNGWPCYVNVVY
jgi:hypothetical protein